MNAFGFCSGNYRAARDEAEEIHRSRSQIVILKRGHNAKFLLFASAERGAITDRFKIAVCDLESAVEAVAEYDRSDMAKKKRKALTLLEPVEPLIHEIRGERVMLDSDLARIYGVPTKVLNQAVKRNADRFPPDFVFRLTEEELETNIRSQSVTASQHVSDMRSQNVTASKRNVRYLPFAFTEHGAIMAANVLNSPRAVEMSVHVIRAFVTLRREAGRYEALARKLAELDRTQKIHGEDIQLILRALQQLEDTTSWAYPDGRRLIGFRPGKSSAEGRK